MDKKEQTYIKGFNNGYLLNKHEPELLAKLLRGDKSHEYIKGLEAGKRQFEKEKLVEQLRSLQEKSKENDREI